VNWKALAHRVRTGVTTARPFFQVFSLPMAKILYASATIEIII